MAVEYFEDEGGQCRYRVKADNGEILTTSEGYRDRTDAERGFEALKRAIAETVFKPDWPQGIRQLPEQTPRVESGPIRFGEDWAGLWLRGDSCFAYALALRAERSQKGDAFSRAGLDGLLTALESTNERTAGG